MDHLERQRMKRRWTVQADDPGLAFDPAHSRFMLCGNPQMIDDTRALLKQRDLQLSLTRRPGQVAVENYW